MLGLVARMIVAMAVVIGLMMVAARVMRTRVLKMGTGSKSSATIEILSRHSMSKSASLVVARIGTKHLVLGVTDNSITPVSELDVIDLDGSHLTSDDLELGLSAAWTTYSGDESNETQTDQTRKGMIEQLRELTARRS